MAIACARILFLSIFPVWENTEVYLFSGIETIVIIGIGAAFFHSVLKISRSRAVFGSIAGNVVSYALIFTLILVVSLLYLLISHF